MNANNLAHPLQWPVGWKRTTRGKQSRYRGPSLNNARNGILHSIRLMGGRDPLLSSNVELKRDGTPYATFKEPEDPGVAIYWTTADRLPMVMACDTWSSVAENAHAIELALDALRQLERTGASQILERAFTGFAALPANIPLPLPPARPWREVLGVADPCTTEDVKAAFRRLTKVRHPDVPTGSHAAMLELNAAQRYALAELRVEDDGFR